MFCGVKEFLVELACNVRLSLHLLKAIHARYTVTHTSWRRQPSLTFSLFRLSRNAASLQAAGQPLSIELQAFYDRSNAATWEEIRALQAAGQPLSIELHAFYDRKKASNKGRGLGKRLAW